MTMLKANWLRCNDCNQASASYEIVSFSTFAPLPEGLNFELVCEHCESSNVKVLEVDNLQQTSVD